MQDVALIDAGGANLGSVRSALDRLGLAARLVRDADELGRPDRVVLPGVGAAAPAMRRLRERGLCDALRATPAPILGICLGMQLLYAHSEEGNVDTLGLLPGTIQALSPAPGVRIPHMGWNDLHLRAPSPLLAGIAEGATVYFVHGYAATPDTRCVASAHHGVEIAAVVVSGRACGMQFHPERSGSVGARLLANFLAWQP